MKTVRIIKTDRTGHSTIEMPLDEFVKTQRWDDRREVVSVNGMQVHTVEEFLEVKYLCMGGLDK